jgi:pimeloyl-ACP methyl ester carboxylesterase
LNNLPNVYFISGLGADKRAFQFLDLSFCNPVFVDWISPLPREHISGYAARIREQIPEEHPIIVGLSFGGMVGAEIARQFPVKKLILLSSAESGKEIPFYLKLLRYLPVHKTTSLSFLQKANRTVYKYMGIDKRSDKILFQEMFFSADGRLIKWAIDQIINWKNNDVLINATHIHGTADILLPRRYVKADYVVEGGEHLMVLTMGEIISGLLRKIILS